MRNSTKIEKRSRGRPRAFEAEDVLDRVREVFMEKGFAAASLDELSAAAGINRPSLYAAFGDKEALYIASLRRYGQITLAALDKLLAQQKPIEDKLKDVYTDAIRLYFAPPIAPGCMIIGTAVTESPTHPEIAAAAIDMLGHIERSLAAAFERAVSQGEMNRQPTPKARAVLAASVFDTLAVRARLGMSSAYLKGYALSMIAAICK